MLTELRRCVKSKCSEASNAASQFSMSVSWQESHSCRVTTSGMVLIMPTIFYPKRSSEFEVQAKVWSKLLDLGMDVRGCVPAEVEDFGRRHKVYFDLVVFSDHRTPICIIECKNKSCDAPFQGLRGRQYRRYSAFAIPIVVCDREQAIESAINKVIELDEKWNFS